MSSNSRSDIASKRDSKPCGNVMTRRPNGMPFTGRGRADDHSNHSGRPAAAVQCSGGLCPAASAAFEERRVLRVLFRLAELPVELREFSVNEIRRDFFVSGELKHFCRL